MTDRRGGRPPFEPSDRDRYLVQVLAGNGVAQAVIAKLIGDGIDLKTLRKHFRRELSDGTSRIRAGLSVVVVRAGLSGDWRAALAWLARFGGPEWRQTEGRLHEFPDGGNLSKLSDEQLQARIDAIDRKSEAGNEKPPEIGGSVH